RYPKFEEKPPFQTCEEIERKIARGGLSAAEQADLWDCLFLTLPEIDDLLAHVKDAARHPFLYPMFVFAAHTGTRRSEMIRSRLDDIDFAAATVTIREKKRVRGTITTRSVPLSPMLQSVLKQWMGEHPGGQQTFCLEPHVPRSRKSRSLGVPLTADEAHDHFKTTLSDSKWDKLRGWHLFRHSFCSNCAAKGIDQRIINGWVGHQTEAMVKRYRHLIPNQEQAAIRTVFSQSAGEDSTAPEPPSPA
ncbi:MAG: site-specific integrase, partial [Pirellulales bacterium]